MPYEKSLISDHLDKETFSADEKDFIKSIIYPRRNNEFDVDDAFGIFIGYEISISKDDKSLSNPDFRRKIQQQIKDEVHSRLSHIENKINEHNLVGHDFYIYVVPFTDLIKTRREIQKEITK
ncbi:hypothetical protein D9M68_802820 [compost metagenome]